LVEPNKQSPEAVKSNSRVFRHSSGGFDPKPQTPRSESTRLHKNSLGNPLCFLFFLFEVCFSAFWWLGFLLVVAAWII